MTLNQYSKQQAIEMIKHTAQNPTVIITPEDHKALGSNLRPGMFKSKSMQTSTSHKAKTCTLSLDEDDILVDTFIDEHSDSNSSPSSRTIPLLHSKPQKRKKPAFKKWHTAPKPPPKPSMLFTVHGALPNSTSDTDKLLYKDGGFINYNEDDEMYKDIITPQSRATSRSRDGYTDGIGKKKPILMNRSYNKQISAKTLDMDYRRMREYKKIVAEGDIISGGESNPSFWRHLKKKHAKQLNGKVLKNKFTFSFEKARYQAVLSRETIPITPCNSPRHVAKKSSGAMHFCDDQVPYIEPYTLPQTNATINNVHIRSSSDQSLPGKDVQQYQPPSKQGRVSLEPIISPREIHSTRSSNLTQRVNNTDARKNKKNKSINLELLHSAKIHNKAAQTAPNSPQVKSKSPVYLSSMSPSKSPLTPQPSSFKKKPHVPVISRPLTPLALSSKFKRKTKSVGRARMAEKMSISIDSPKIAHEISKLNDKRRKLERIGSKRQLDTGGVAWKLNYWKANQLKNDPRMKALERRRKQRRRMERNDEALRASDRLSLKRVESDPQGKAPVPNTMVSTPTLAESRTATSQKDLHSEKTKTKWKKALWRRFGSKERNSIKAQQQDLQVHRSYNAYMGMDTDIHHSHSDTVRSSSDSHLASSSSSGGEYSNSDEHKHGPYPSRTKKKKRKRRKQKNAKQSKNESLRIDGEMINEVRYNKTPIFCEGATDSEADPSNNGHRSSLKAFAGIKPGKPVKYKKARTFSPRTPKLSQHRIQNIVDIDRWEVKDVWNYIVALFPEMNCYEENIIKSKINGIDFVLMQNEMDLKSLFEIQYPPHVMILLTMTRTLLMSYEGTNQNVLKAKASHS
eukprot:76669_1